MSRIAPASVYIRSLQRHGLPDTEGQSVETGNGVLLMTAILRSMLFVPADRPERFAKAVASGADAIILDLEDSVTVGRKADARKAVQEWLRSGQNTTTLVRVNSIDSDLIADDLAALADCPPAGIILPKAEGSASVKALFALWGQASMPPVLPIATETAAAIFELGSFRDVSSKLVGISWGAEDLPAAIGARSSRDDAGQLLPPYVLARSLTLFAAHAAGVAALETVYPNIDDMEGLAAYVADAARDGFTGMLAIHPRQVAVINAGFTPSDAEIAHAAAIVQAFVDNPGAGVLKVEGKMVDAPHLKQAQRVLALNRTLSVTETRPMLR